MVDYWRENWELWWYSSYSPGWCQFWLQKFGSMYSMSHFWGEPCWWYIYLLHLTQNLSPPGSRWRCAFLLPWSSGTLQRLHSSQHSCGWDTGTEELKFVCNKSVQQSEMLENHMENHTFIDLQSGLSIEHGSKSLCHWNHTGWQIGIPLLDWDNPQYIG